MTNKEFDKMNEYLKDKWDLFPVGSLLGIFGIEKAYSIVKKAVETNKKVKITNNDDLIDGQGYKYY